MDHSHSHQDGDVRGPFFSRALRQNPESFRKEDGDRKTFSQESLRRWVSPVIETIGVALNRKTRAAKKRIRFGKVVAHFFILSLHGFGVRV
jgi:hypothetical protein